MEKSEFHNEKWWAQNVSSSWGWRCAFSLPPLVSIVVPGSYQALGKCPLGEYSMNVSEKKQQQ